jgi:proline dehydrogenase
MNLLNTLVAHTLPIVPKPIVARVSARYIAGTTLDDAAGVVQTLNEEGILGTLDVLGEFIQDLSAADRTVAQYTTALDRIHAAKLNTSVSIKLTGLGLLLDPERCYQNVVNLVTHADRLGNWVRIDMEDSSITDATIDVYRRLRADGHTNVGIVLQAYLRRTLGDVAALRSLKPSVRVCKGIYVESRDISFKDREIIRRNYVDTVRALLEAGSYVGIATHDETVVWECERVIRRLGIGHDRYEFQMLLGVDEQLRSIIQAAGHRMRVYVPFGEKWYEYSLRRLKENPAIAGHVMRAALGFGPSRA